jgi:hypothetical protein
MSLAPQPAALPRLSLCFAFHFLICSLLLGLSLRPTFASAQDAVAPKYDLQTETKSKGIVEEEKLVTVGSRKDFTQLIIKSGDEKLTIYVCPKPYQDEMGITFAKGDEVSVTGSKVKQDAGDLILARELVKGTDTFMFRDSKGKPVWDPRTGK